jgi:hypothetical protein
MCSQMTAPCAPSDSELLRIRRGMSERLKIKPYLRMIAQQPPGERRVQSDLSQVFEVPLFVEELRFCNRLNRSGAGHLACGSFSQAE